MTVKPIWVGERCYFVLWPPTFKHIETEEEKRQTGLGEICGPGGNSKLRKDF